MLLNNDNIIKILHTYESHMLQKNTNMNINDIEIDSTLENNGKQTGFFVKEEEIL